MSNKLKYLVGLLSVALIISACGGGDKSTATSAVVADTTSNAPDTTPNSTSDTTGDELATDAMVSAIQGLLDLGATSEASAPDLDACPLGDFDALLAKAPAETTAAASVEGEVVSYVYQPEGEPPHLQCGRGDLGVYTGLVPQGDYNDELTAVLGDFVLTFDDDVAYLGGTIVSFCAELIGVGADAFCETDWYDDNVWVGVFISGDARSSEQSAQWLTAILWDVVTTVPQLAPTVSLVS